MSGNEFRVSLRVQPGAIRSELVGSADGVWRMKVAAPPVKGKANKELIAFLSRVLAINRSALTIVAGHTSRNKVVVIQGLNEEEVVKRLSSKLSSSSDSATSR